MTKYTCTCYESGDTYNTFADSPVGAAQEAASYWAKSDMTSTLNIYLQPWVIEVRPTTEIHMVKLVLPLNFEEVNE